MATGNALNQVGRSGDSFGVAAGTFRFLASAASTHRLQSTMLSNMASPDPQWKMALARWQEIGSSQRPETGLAHRQSAWDKHLLDRIISDLRSRLLTWDTGRVLERPRPRTPVTGCWPSPSPIAG